MTGDIGTPRHLSTDGVWCSGQFTTRNLLNRYGDRQLNRALRTIGPGPATLRRATQGLHRPQNLRGQGPTRDPPRDQVPRGIRPHKALTDHRSAHRRPRLKGDLRATGSRGVVGKPRANSFPCGSRRSSPRLIQVGRTAPPGRLVGPGTSTSPPARTWTGGAERDTTARWCPRPSRRGRTTRHLLQQGVDEPDCAQLAPARQVGPRRRRRAALRGNRCVDTTARAAESARSPPMPPARRCE